MENLGMCKFIFQDILKTFTLSSSVLLSDLAKNGCQNQNKWEEVRL
jgi:hypothetical protein